METTPAPVESKRPPRSAEALAKELKELGDEIQWRNHRATAEVRDAVRLVAGELKRTADALQASGPALIALRDEVAVQRHLAVLEAKDKVALLADVARHALRGAAQSPTFLGETARVQLALAKMEASDLLNEKRRRLEEELHRLEAQTEAALREVEERVAAIRAAVRP